MTNYHGFPHIPGLNCASYHTLASYSHFRRTKRRRFTVPRESNRLIANNRLAPTESKNEKYTTIDSLLYDTYKIEK